MCYGKKRDDMELTAQLAGKIVREVGSVLDEDIVVVDTTGTIIASTESSRIGSFHEGAYRVAGTGKRLYITKEKAAALRGVKPGINMPILYEDVVIGAIGITGNPDNVEPFADIIRRMTELVLAESYHVEQLEWKNHGVETFVYEWTAQTRVDEAFLQRGRMLGFSMDTPYRCVLLELHAEHTVSYAANKTLTDWFDNRFPRSSRDHLIRWGPERFLLLIEQRKQKMKSFLLPPLEAFQKQMRALYDVSLSVGISQSGGHQLLNKPYEEAKKAAQTARIKGDIVFYEDLLLEILLQEVPAAARAEYVRRVFKDVRRDPSLVKTLQAYFQQQLSIKKTAAVLHIHVNTLHYRLKRIESMTGLDPRKTDGLVMLALAVTVDEGLDESPKN